MVDLGVLEEKEN